MSTLFRRGIIALNLAMNFSRLGMLLTENISSSSLAMTLSSIDEFSMFFFIDLIDVEKG